MSKLETPNMDMDRGTASISSYTFKQFRLIFQMAQILAI